MSNGKCGTVSLFGSPLNRLAGKLAPRVRDDLVAVLVSEVERHFKEKLLFDLQQSVQTLLAENVPPLVDDILKGELLP